MTFEPDISDDCMLVDGTETVTLRGSATVSVAGAKRGLLLKNELASGALGLEPSDLAWSLPEASLAGTQPRPGDAIEDATGTRWTILHASRAPLTALWRTLCRQQR
jgi:hypothetical protein